VLAVFLSLSSSAAASTASYPFTTPSYYISTESTTDLLNSGCAAAQAGDTGTIFLNFGRPALYNGAYGTIDFHGSGVFVSNVLISDLVSSFAQGYYQCSSGSEQAVIARGTSNNGMNSTDCNGGSKFITGCTGGNCAYNFGYHWADWNNTTEGYIIQDGWSSRIESIGGYDAEPAWNPSYQQSYDLANGFNSQTSSYSLFVDGSVDPGFWSSLQEWNIAYGLTYDFPFPQVYYQNFADEWETLDLWAASNKGAAMYVVGVMSTTTGFTAHQAYDALLHDLQGHSSTYQSSIPYLTNIHF
jgi:hypothetical protein